MHKKAIRTAVWLMVLSVCMAGLWKGTRAFNGVLDEELFLAHFGNGDGLVSEIVLVNANQDSVSQTEISFLDDDGNPMMIDINGQMVTGQMRVQVPASGARRLATSGLGPVIQGWVRVRSDLPLDATVLFGGDLGLAGVGRSVPLEHGFLTPLEEGGASLERTGIAVANLEGNAVELELRLYNSAGMWVDTATAGLPADGHLSRFADEFDWQGTTDFSNFEGSLEVLSSGKTAATALKVRPGQLASLPVTPLPEDQRFQPRNICPGLWTGTFDNQENSPISFRVVSQLRIESIEVGFTGCNGQPAMATADSAAIDPDHSFSTPLTGTDLLGNVSGAFAEDGQSVQAPPGGVFLLLQCGGGNFSWRANPIEPCG